MVIDIGNFNQNMSELLQTVYTEPLGICWLLCLNFQFKFWVLQFRRKGCVYEGPIEDISELSRKPHT